MTRLQDKTFGYPPLVLSSDPRVCFTLEIFSAKTPEIWFQRERTLDYQPTQNVCAILLLKSLRDVYKVRQNGSTEWKSRPFHVVDAFPLVLVLLRHPKFWHPDSVLVILPSERSRQAGIQVFPSRLCPLPRSLCLQSLDFSPSPPIPCTEMQTLAVIYTSTRSHRSHLAARHQDMLFLLKVIFLTGSLPGRG